MSSTEPSNDLASGRCNLSVGAFARLQRLFHEALEQPDALRASWLATACAGDQPLFDDLIAMLATVHEDDSGWVHAFVPPIDEDGYAAAATTMVGRTIGAYEVTRLIGFGGMGAVYEGVRVDSQFSMRVAIKMLRRGADSELAVQRFRYERQILANLRHRNIAALLDGGVTDDQQPYFVMEYVDGQSITAYCRERSLGVRSRIMLLRQVCAAVQHAHESLVVHRDLKPANVHVTADGTVKLLDFGIARLMRQPAGLDYLPATEGNLRLFTPDYASPEQFQGLPAQPSSDIYSLGVISCEVLTGHRPFVLSGLLLAQMQSTVCTAPAPVPSSLLTSGDAAALGVRSVARARALLHTELDAIVLQSLRKEPDRRYRTAEQMNADLQRYLDGHPVLAQRDRLGYRASKFIKRHRVEVGAAALVLAALLSATGISLRSARRADAERLKATQVNEFLQTMLGAASPDVGGRDVTVTEVLSQATRDLRSRRLSPEIEGDIRLTLASTYNALGIYDSAAVHAVRAFELRRAQYGLRDSRTANALAMRAATAENLGRYAHAESLATAAVALHRATKPVDGNGLSTALDNLARVVEQAGRVKEAEGIKRELLALRRRGTDSASRAGLTFALTNMAISMTYRGDNDSAEFLQREALANEAAVHGTRGPNYADVQRGLSSILEDQGNYAAADSLMRLALPVMREALGPTHSTYLRVVSNASRLRLRLRDFSGAESLARSVVEQIGTTLPESESTATASLQVLGAALDSLGRYREAEAVVLRMLALRKRSLPAGSWMIAGAEATLGAHYLLTSRYREAEPLLIGAYAVVAKEHGEGAPNATSIARRLVMLYEKMGQPGRVAEWRRHADAPPPK